MASSKHVAIPKCGVDYRGKVVLAPMVRSGELPSRLMALKYGADLVWGPETVDRAIKGCAVRTNPRTSCVEFTRTPSNGGRPKPADGNGTPPPENVIYRIFPSRESSRLIFQLGTADPTLAVEAASVVAPYVAGIDVNAGCPKPFSTSGGMGAALLSTPDLLCDILRALVGHVGAKWEIGISVKIRILPREEDTKALVTKLCGTGITGLTVHCRTRSMRKTEKAVRDQLAMVAETCRAAGVACLMNGDVMDRQQAESLAEKFGADGAMIATAAEKNPSVFRGAQEGGAAGWEEVVKGYMKEAIFVENRWGNTKFLLAQLIPGKVQGHIGLSQAKNNEDICRRLGFEDLAAEGKQLDDLLGLTARETKSEQKAKRKAENSANKPKGDDAKRQKSQAWERPAGPLEAQRQRELDHLADSHHEVASAQTLTA